MSTMTLRRSPESLRKDEYFAWLYSLVDTGDRERKQYWRLLGRLHKKEFVWFIPNDDNRAIDGIALREHFADDYSLDKEDCLRCLDGPCSFLEMLIAMSFRCANDIYDDESNIDIFWEMLDNIGLIGREFQDGYFGPEQIMKVDEAVGKVVTRGYCKDGKGGGLFPLEHPEKDQRRVELWYQMQSYILEKQKSFKSHWENWETGIDQL